MIRCSRSGRLWLRGHDQMTKVCESVLSFLTCRFEGFVEGIQEGEVHRVVLGVANSAVRP